MDSQSGPSQQVPYEIDVAPDGNRWRYRKRWRRGLRRFLPSLWHATDEHGLALLKRDNTLAQGSPHK